MMGSYWNFKNSTETPQPEGGGSKPVGNFPLARQSSVYSLTFDEFQNTLLGSGKDFGSMNMDELLKNIGTAEETQAVTSYSNGAGDGNSLNGNLQRQGSLTLPRTLSQKTVDEVWRDLFKENNGVKDGSGGGGVSHLPQRQPTLGEITLEEFLVRAGVVREDAQPIPNNGGFYGGLSQQNNNTAGLSLGFHQAAAQNNVVLANPVTQNNNSVPNQSSSLPLNVSGIRSSQQQLQQQHPKPQPIFPKQANVAFGSALPLVNNAQLASPGATRRPMVGMVNPSSISSGLVQNSVIQSGVAGLAGMGAGAVVAGAGSPGSQVSSDEIGKSNEDKSLLSPPPYLFGGGARGRRCGGTLEKAMERRHKRMIKNRESAARSRARKQAYTLELEAEVAKLKEINQELQRKQDEIMEMQQNQVLATMNMPLGSKRLCLRRTLTGPW